MCMVLKEAPTRPRARVFYCQWVVFRCPSVSFSGCRRALFVIRCFIFSGTAGHHLLFVVSSNCRDARLVRPRIHPRTRTILPRSSNGTCLFVREGALFVGRKLRVGRTHEPCVPTVAVVSAGNSRGFCLLLGGVYRQQPWFPHAIAAVGMVNCPFPESRPCLLRHLASVFSTSHTPSAQCR